MEHDCENVGFIMYSPLLWHQNSIAIVQIFYYIIVLIGMCHDSNQKQTSLVKFIPTCTQADTHNKRKITLADILCGDITVTQSSLYLKGLTPDCLCVNALPDLIYRECSLMSSVMT